MFSSKYWCLLSSLPETSVKAWKGCMLLDGVANKSAIVDFTHVTIQPEVKFLLPFYNDRAICWACAGKTNMVSSGYGSLYLFIYIYIATNVRFTLNYVMGHMVAVKSASSPVFPEYE